MRRILHGWWIRLFGSPAYTKHSVGRYRNGMYSILKGWVNYGDTIFLGKKDERIKCC